MILMALLSFLALFRFDWIRLTDALCLTLTPHHHLESSGPSLLLLFHPMLSPPFIQSSLSFQIIQSPSLPLTSFSLHHLLFSSCSYIIVIHPEHPETKNFLLSKPSRLMTLHLFNICLSSSTVRNKVLLFDDMTQHYYFLLLNIIIYRFSWL